MLKYNFAEFFFNARTVYLKMYDFNNSGNDVKTDHTQLYEFFSIQFICV